MVTSNSQQNQINEETLVQKIINKHNAYSLGWLMVITAIIFAFSSIHGLISTLIPSPVNFHFQVSSLIMFAFSFGTTCNLLYMNHRILQDFESEKISDGATINYKLVHRSILFILIFGAALLCIFSIIDFMNPPL